MKKTYFKENKAIRHYRCDRCNRQIYPSEIILIEMDRKGKIFNIYCIDCMEKIKKGGKKNEKSKK